MKLPSAKKYPKTLNVKDETYEIRMVARIPGETKGLSGLCDGDRRIIWIRKNQSPVGLFRTFTHEVLHALEFEWKIPIRHKMVYQLELALSALMTDNF
jgi:hypothetical protein